MRLLLAIALLMMAGCLKPDPTGPGKTDAEISVRDQNLLAGATSSTNWPQEDGGSLPVAIRGKADSVITLYFTEVLTRIKVTGKVTLYKAGYIPALDTAPKVEYSFAEAESLIITGEQISTLGSDENDSIYFSVGLVTDTAQSLLTGFIYSKKRNILLNSPFSSLLKDPTYLQGLRFGFSGFPDSAMSEALNETEGKTELCFYIPGSPYFWRELVGDTLLAPLPSGKFPIRLLRIERDAEIVGTFQIEAFEVTLEKKIDTTGQKFDVKWVFHVGERIFSTSSKGSPSIRTESP